jgi:competence protein ComEA
MRAWRGYVAVSLVWVAILVIALWITRRPPSSAIEIVAPPTAPPTQPLPPSPTPTPLHVDVAGAVMTPGVYRLLPGSIVADAIAIAGGPADDADLDRLNKAVELRDGDLVVVPRRGETAATPAARSGSAPTGSAPGAAEPEAVGGLIDLNGATIEELEALPGIGPVLAQRIMDGRPYAATEDLLRVQGIGHVLHDKIQHLITVR